MNAARMRFRRRPDQAANAIRLQLDFEVLGYRKWGMTQTARAGDWFVDNGVDVYSVEADYFASTAIAVSSEAAVLLE